MCFISFIDSCATNKQRDHRDDQSGANKIKPTTVFIGSLKMLAENPILCISSLPRLRCVNHGYRYYGCTTSTDVTVIPECSYQELKESRVT